MDNNNQNPYTLDFSANETTESQETSINEKKNIDVVVADASLVGKTCPFCKTDIKEGDEIIVCPSCNTPHHKECWGENKGCTTFGCSEQYYEEQHTNPTDACVNCGTPLGDGQAFCPKCGRPKGAVNQNICSKCGTELQPDQMYCQNCGQRVDRIVDPNVSAAINQFNQNVTVKKKPKKVGLIIVLVLIIVGIVGSIAYVGISNVIADREKAELKSELMAETWCSFYGSLKLYLDFDNNSVEYSAKGTYVGWKTLSTFDYIVISGDTIEINGKEIKVKIKDDTVTFSPSFVDTSSYSIWVR